MQTVHVLLVESDPEDARRIGSLLGEIPGMDLHCADGLAAGLTRIAMNGADVVLLDLGPAESGTYMETLRSVIASIGAVPIVLLTERHNEELGQAAVHEGAQDFLCKERLSGILLSQAVRYAVERNAIRSRLRHINCVLQAIRRINQLMLRERDPERLIRSACAMLVEERGYRAAWLALAAPNGPPAAFAETGWSDSFAAFGAELRRGAFPPCWLPALMSDAGLVMLDSGRACRSCPLWTAGGHERACVAVLRHDARLYGMLGIYPAPGAVLDDEEKSVILELAGDLSLAIHGIETERERAAYAQIVENSRDSMALIDRGYVFTQANPSCARLLGFTEEGISGRHAAEILGEGLFREKVRPPLDRCFNGETVRFEIAFRIQGRGERFAEAQASPCRSADGEVVFSTLSVRDITDRKREEELFKARARLFIFSGSHGLDEILEETLNEAEALTFSLIGFYHFVDADQVSLTLQNWSTRTKRDFCTAEGKGRHYEIAKAGVWVDCIQRREAVIHNDYASLPHRKGLPAGHASITRELVVPVIRGEKIAAVLGVGNKPFDYDEQDVRIVSMLADLAWDIAEAVRAKERQALLEDQLRVSQKMEAIGSLAGGVAHDFNNLLSLILGYSESAMTKAGEDGPIRDDLREVMNAGKHAADLTRQLLAFSRKQVLQPVPMDLNEVVTRASAMLKRIIGEDIEIVRKLAGDLWGTVADPGQLNQVVMNLAVNARDAMPKGGTLTLETSNAAFEGEFVAHHEIMKPGEYVVLAISDTGCGMDERTRSRLFEPFFTTKELGKGTGLGLSTVYGIVKQSGGNIWVYSEPGRGTTFKIFLPRQSAAGAPAPEKPAGTAAGQTGSETILMVEDEDKLRKFINIVLTKAGYTVLAAGNGEEAIAAASRFSGEIHLLLSDVIMPRMNGQTLARELEKARPSLKVLFMSGYTDAAIANHGVLEPGINLINKPFTQAGLLVRIRDVLGSRESAPV